jgi:ankyrin repeat protein
MTALNVNPTFLDCLQLACKEGNLPIVQFLIEHGADLNHENDNGLSVPLLLKMRRDIEIITF